MCSNHLVQLPEFFSFKLAAFNVDFVIEMPIR